MIPAQGKKVTIQETSPLGRHHSRGAIIPGAPSFQGRHKCRPYNPGFGSSIIDIESGSKGVPTPLSPL
ncbi:MAG: hypothetical protein DYH02_05435 [Candidatus Omnitrophica bacterium COP1]|nr:hypothetical protein [Candidatus Omnitrophica bacterium COP1]